MPSESARGVSAVNGARLLVDVLSSAVSPLLRGESDHGSSSTLARQPSPVQGVLPLLDPLWPWRVAEILFSPGLYIHLPTWCRWRPSLRPRLYHIQVGSPFQAPVSRSHPTLWGRPNLKETGNVIPFGGCRTEQQARSRLGRHRSQLDGVLNYVEAEEVALVGEDDGR